jgi:hypothetical protein
MSETNEQARVKMIALIDKRGEFDTLEDGYVYHFPTVNGAYSSYQLRWIADELDARNKDWDAQINKYFESQEVPPIE